jgi:ATP-dependent helicase YprA (DUF1998 family)
VGIRNVEVIRDDGSPHGEKTFVLWNPPIMFMPVIMLTFLLVLIASICCGVKSLRRMKDPLQGCAHCMKVF